MAHIDEDRIWCKARAGFGIPVPTVRLLAAVLRKRRLPHASDVSPGLELADRLTPGRLQEFDEY